MRTKFEHLKYEFLQNESDEINVSDPDYSQKFNDFIKHKHSLIKKLKSYFMEHVDHSLKYIVTGDRKNLYLGPQCKKLQ